MSQVSPERRENCWCALVVGNSRLHWGVFVSDQLQQTWDVAYQNEALLSPQLWSDWVSLSPAFQYLDGRGETWSPLFVVSVVPKQTESWLDYPHVSLIKLSDIPLQQTYTTLGCDRALAVWTAGQLYGFPTLVIDGGTALTLTGADAEGNLVGGAILPGVGLQLRSLSTSTALPTLQQPGSFPPRWARNTPDAIYSGVLYTIWSGLSSFIHHWMQTYQESQIVLTGGDHQLLAQGLQTAGLFSCGIPLQTDSMGSDDLVPWQNGLVCDDRLLFRGIQRLRTKSLESQ